MKILLGIALLGLGVVGCDSADSPTGGQEPETAALQAPPGFPPMLLPPDNPNTTAGVALGRRLFFDPILSVDSTRACASCHLPEAAFSDPQPFSEGVAGFTGRNSMPLMNLAWMEVFFWDGRAISLEDQALQPVEDPLEMGESWPNVVAKLVRHREYPTLFEEAFPGQGISADLTVKAIAQFERTLISHQSKYDRVIAGLDEFSAEEELGWALFNNERGDCFHCHGPGLFTDNQFHNNGLDAEPVDEGLAALTGWGPDRGKFKSPSLRNIEYTAPYMHDGRFATLEEVLQFYNEGIQEGPLTDPLLRLIALERQSEPLTAAEQAALIAFMKTLSDPSFLSSVQPPK